MGGGEQLVINGFSYEIVQINNLLWTNADLKSLFDGIAFAPSDKWYLGAAAKIYDNDVATYGVYGQNRGLLYNAACRQIIQNWLDTNYPGWRIPKIQDYTNIINFCGGTIPAFNKLCEARLWPGLEDITNEFGFNAIPTGRVSAGNFSNVSNAYYMTSESESPFACAHAYYTTNRNELPTG